MVYIVNMEQQITLTNLNPAAGNKHAGFTQYALSIKDIQQINTLTGILGIFVPTFSIILPLVIGATQPDYNPVKQTISELVYYPQGWLLATIFTILGIWLALLSLKCYASYAHKTTTKIAALLIAVLALGFFTIAICPTNIPGKELTLIGLIHEKTAQMICSLLPVICVLMIPEFKTNKYWRKLTVFTKLTALTGLVLGIIGALIVMTNTPLLGIIERLIFLNAAIWFIVIGINIISQESSKQNSTQKTNEMLIIECQTTQ